MRELIWNDGMSVGIDAIDDDHKQIIAILAKLTSTHSDKISNKVIENVFNELKEYVLLHFSREEKLLEEANYKDIIKHKASHQKFIEKLPVLKQQWVEEDNLACSEKIITFLHKWIVNHIIKDDFDYISTLQNDSSLVTNKLINSDEKLSNNSSNKSLLAQLSNTFSQKIKLSKRLFIIAFVPVLGVLLLSLIILQNNYQQYKNMSLLLGLNHVIMQVNDVSHSLQAERGLSSGLTSSNYQNFTKKLSQQRTITDQAIAKFLLLTENSIDPSVQKNIQSYFDSTRSNFKNLIVLRQELDNKSVGFIQIYQSYTLLIEQLLSISENLTDVDMNSQLANNISAISSMLVFKEYMGQIRAIGMNMVSGNNNDIYSNLDISLLLGKQIHALHVFNNAANSQQKVLCANFCDKKMHMQMLQQAFSQSMNSQNIEIRGKYWFDFMSGEINKLKALTDSLTFNFKNTVSGESHRLRNIYLTTFFVLAVFLIGAILFSSILNFSIITPIRRITDALNGMVRGDLNIHFTNTANNDEIGAIQFAYEKLRRRLLQIDVFQVVLDSQKEEIEYRKTQQEHFKVLAYTDALTGAVNRHQFNQVLEDEISRANFEQQALSILLIDIDHFKKINDNFGHAVGDEVLIMFYQACKNIARNDDVVARIGGEEFVIVLPQTNEKSAYQFAERLREYIQKLDVVINTHDIKFTVSIGVSQWQSNVFSCAENFVADADKLLYQAKNKGRNKVVTYTH